MLCTFHGKHNRIFSGHTACTRATNTLVSPQCSSNVCHTAHGDQLTPSADSGWGTSPGCTCQHRLCSMSRFEASRSYGRRDRVPEVALGGPLCGIMLAMECAKHFLPSAASRDVPVCHYKAPTVRVPTSCTSLHALHGRQRILKNSF